MAEMLSALAPAYAPGRHGSMANGAGVTLSEQQPGSIVQVAAWPGHDAALRAAIAKATGLKIAEAPGSGAAAKTGAAFAFAPGRWLVVGDNEGLASALSTAIGDSGTVTDLSHGRTALRIDGAKAEWVLAKLFAIDFGAIAVGNAVSTNHHEIFAQIQRTGPSRFDLYVFRSFARSFWTVLCGAAEEVGYEVR
jgi:heterotetrameric sarcosine oxidase gamma subunit